MLERASRYKGVQWIEARQLLLTRLPRPRRWDCQTLIASMEKSQHVSAKHITDVFHSRYSRSIRLNGPMSDVKTRIDDGKVVFFGSVLKIILVKSQRAESLRWSVSPNISQWQLRLRSSRHQLEPSHPPNWNRKTLKHFFVSWHEPFSYRCLLAGWTVHQQASPWLCSCKPTSNESLSFDEDVDKQAKY